MGLSKKQRLETERQLWAIVLLGTAAGLLEKVGSDEAQQVRAEIDLWFKGKHAD
jgi:hypothetical protein